MKQREIDRCPILLPDGSSDDRSLVIVIGGSSGGLRSIDQAQFYASRGFPAAVIPYFGMEGLPPELKLIPLEYFADCVRRITALPELRQRAVFVQGTSKGAEASLLLCATRTIDVDGVILISPSRYVWGASADLEDLRTGRVTEESSWSREGKPVDFVPFSPERSVAPTIETIDDTACLVFRDTWYPKVSGSLGEIDLSRLDTKLLIFSGQDDQLWPSYRAGCEIESALESLGKRTHVRHVSFSGVGHQIPYPGKEPVLHQRHPQLGYAISYGGSMNRTREASEVWWQEVEAFVNGSSVRP